MGSDRISNSDSRDRRDDLIRDAKKVARRIMETSCSIPELYCSQCVKNWALANALIKRIEAGENSQ